ncbi:translocation protein SEC62-like isoform X2 [Watersipora subatra]|uniref:translocation protein SEC62-like isoform X2 n=1 Tax=Watersipora subatra TaxID=2589382 RepID=UPI00355AE2FB
MYFDEEGDQPAPKADSRDKSVAKYIHKKIPKRIGDLYGMEVTCFYGEDAINCLLDSPWATGKDAIFTDRLSVVRFCHELLLKELFHRATLVKRKPKSTAVTDGNDTPGESGAEGKKGKKKTKPKDEEAKETTSEEKSEKSKKPKKVKKLKLEMSDGQYFEDGREIFVWIYEPGWQKFFIGFAILATAIALCCYPLWPEWLRIAVYYLSLVGAAFLAVIIALAIVRYIVWAIIYVITWRRHSFFLFPNLTEDCGVLESFVPIYTYTDLSKEGDKSKKGQGSRKTETKNEAKEEQGSPSDSVAGESEAGKEEGGSVDGSEHSQGSEEDFEVIDKAEVTH